MSDLPVAPPLVLLVHSASYDRLYQAAALALGACHLGRKVYLILYFGALEKYLERTWDLPDFEESDPTRRAWLIERSEEWGNPSPQQLLDAARATGQLQILACSASVRFLHRELAEVAQQVDQLIGIPMALQLAQEAQTLYL